MRDEHEKWLPSQWQKLMEMTLQAFDSVTDEKQPPPVWTLGGETSLAIDLEHRLSYNINVSVDSASVVKRMVPVINPVTAAICWDSDRGRAIYQYTGHALKMVLDRIGEIEFRTFPSLVDNSMEKFIFNGRVIERERPCEVIAKKIYYGGTTLQSRDVCDLAGTFLLLPNELSLAAGSLLLTPEVYYRARLRIENMMDVFKESMSKEINATEFGKSYMENASELALEALDFMQYGPRPVWGA